MSETIGPDQITDLENKIIELEKRMPAHSVPATLMQELEDLEEELASLKQGDNRMTVNISEDEVREALEQVKHPAIDLSLVKLGIVKEISVAENIVNITMAFPFAGIPIETMLINSVRNPVEKLGAEVEIKTTLMNPNEVQEFLAMEQSAWKGL